MSRNIQSQMTCPECASHDLQLRQPRGIGDFVLEVCGSYRWRCRNCQRVFRANPLRMTDLWYAKCPRCLNQHLQHAGAEPAESTSWTNVRAALGAHRCQCSHCGHHFATYRAIRHQQHRPAPMVSRAEGVEFEPMQVPTPVRHAWRWLRNPPRVVVRVRIRYRLTTRP